MECETVTFDWTQGICRLEWRRIQRQVGRHRSSNMGLIGYLDACIRLHPGSPDATACDWVTAASTEPGPGPRHAFCASRLILARAVRKHFRGALLASPDAG
jgi:hypothetical protein